MLTAKVPLFPKLQTWKRQENSSPVPQPRSAPSILPSITSTLLGLVTVFDAILTSRQTRLK